MSRIFRQVQLIPAEVLWPRCRSVRAGKDGKCALLSAWSTTLSERWTKKVEPLGYFSTRDARHVGEKKEAGL